MRMNPNIWAFLNGFREIRREEMGGFFGVCAVFLEDFFSKAGDN
jgi:hypothetical protein